MSAPATRDPLDALEKHFGFRKFLEGQERVVSALVSGQDCMVIMPTGGGKSLCYQLPALVMDGVTVVVSPLIALMKDQVDGLLEKGIPATMINSTVGLPEQQERIAKLREGAYKLVYIAPERFRSRTFTDALRSVDIALFAVDEAHCLSQWGHDFRPDYLRLGRAVEELGRPQTAAFTATATPEVRTDIMATLGLRDPFVSLSGFGRPNLSLAVTHTKGKKEKFTRLRDVIGRHKTGIVYCATRKRVDEVALELDQMGVSFIPYHGGMEDSARSHAQDQFIKKERDVVVATNAFGMGIDRPDVRFVVHFDIPGSVEAYYQEAGRAGRDGEPAVCELLFNYADTRTQEFFIDGSNPGYALIRDVYNYLRNAADPQHEVRLTIQEITENLGEKNSMGISSSLAALGRAGHIDRFDIPGQRARGTRITRPDTLPDELRIDRDALEEKERRDRAKLETIVRFCYAEVCRQEFILDYFGQEETVPCGNCDTCGENGTQERREGTGDEVLALRKALSGVARMSYRNEGQLRPRYGKGKVVQMLVGGRSQEVLSTRLDQLSTYGLLKELGSSHVYELLREAERAGLLRTDKTGDYPLLGITAKGLDAMRSATPVTMCWPSGPPRSHRAKGGRSEDKTTTPSVGLEELGFDEVLYGELREKRTELAEAEGGVPPYVIFSNQTLEFFARLKPATTDAGKRIRGVGDVKAEKYLPEFISVIRTHLEKLAEGNP